MIKILGSVENKKLTHLMTIGGLVNRYTPIFLYDIWNMRINPPRRIATIRVNSGLPWFGRVTKVY